MTTPFKAPPISIPIQVKPFPAPAPPGGPLVPYVPPAARTIPRAIPKSLPAKAFPVITRKALPAGARAGGGAFPRVAKAVPLIPKWVSPLLWLPLIPALMEPFAPAVHRWLNRGWKHVPGADDYPWVPVGGTNQCYNLVGTTQSVTQNCDSNAAINVDVTNVYGPIGQGSRLLNTLKVTCTDKFHDLIERWTTDGGGRQYAKTIWWDPDVPGQVYDVVAIRCDGTLEPFQDTTAPPVTSPYPPTQNPVPLPAEETPLPSAPGSPTGPSNQPPGGPGVEAPGGPSDRPVPTQPTSPGTGGGPGSGSGSNPTYPDRPPNPDDPPVPEPEPDPDPPDPDPPDPDPEPDPEGCCEALLLGQARILAELAKLGQPSIDVCPDTETITFSTVKCLDGERQIEPWSVEIISPPPDGLVEALSDSAELAALACDKDSTVAVPEWWQVRVGADRPQLVCTFRVADSHTYHTYSIPWPASSAPRETPVIPSFTKGNFQAMLVYRDNSKFIINCSTESEAKKLIDVAAAASDPEMLLQPIRAQITIRRGHGIAIAKMLPTSMAYYPTGQKNLLPEWRRRVRLN